jgi:hypothetical protein
MKKLCGRLCVLSVLVGLWLPGTCGVSTDPAEADLSTDAAIVLRHFGGGMSDYTMLAVTIVCHDGKPQAMVEAEPNGKRIRRAEVKITLERYLALWRELEANGIWGLPSGEFWPWREWLEADADAPVALVLADYKGEERVIDAGVISVEVRVKERTHGFMRYALNHLKDGRYEHANGAICDAVELDKVLRQFYPRGPLVDEP